MSPETTPDPDEPAYRSIWTALCDVSFTQGWLDVGGVSTRYAEAGPPDAARGTDASRHRRPLGDVRVQSGPDVEAVSLRRDRHGGEWFLG